MAHAYGGIGLCRSLSLPPLSQSLSLPPLRLSLPLPHLSSSMASTSSVEGPSAPSTLSWGRGTGRRGPTRGVIERRLPDGQQWNVSVVRGYGMGPTADHFTSRMGVVSKMYCKIWQKDFAKLPVATKELIFRDLQSLDDVIASVPPGVDFSDWKSMCEMWTTGDEREAMTQMIAPSSDVVESHTPATPKDAFNSVFAVKRSTSWEKIDLAVFAVRVVERR
ncbi:hypothetical protein Taro_035858 [Colocasia esculenta]|uniref:Uncharacterized protein n=1 Tax=Colocasia esculenta TaxID=4460 RepID=A0A843WG21_COLES|nr:hypothetical protein [Colocasia esculenta]